MIDFWFSRPKIWGYPSILGSSLEKNPPNRPKNEKRRKNVIFSMVFCLNRESNNVPSWKNIGTHTDYYYLSRKFCFYVFYFLFHEKSGKKQQIWWKQLLTLLTIWSRANYFLISNDFPNEFSASLIKFNQSKQVAQVNVRKWLYSRGELQGRQQTSFMRKCEAMIARWGRNTGETW